MEFIAEIENDTSSMDDLVKVKLSRSFENTKKGEAKVPQYQLRSRPFSISFPSNKERKEQLGGKILCKDWQQSRAQLFAQTTLWKMILIKANQNQNCKILQ